MKAIPLYCFVNSLPLVRITDAWIGKLQING
jgi:hypothetical protein